MTTILINSFSFTTEGLKINYTTEGQTTKLSFDAKASADLFQQFGVIEGWDIDRNGEPVILYTDNQEGIGYGFEMWCQFVSSFGFNEKYALLIVEMREDLRRNQERRAIVSRMYSKLEAFRRA